MSSSSRNSFCLSLFFKVTKFLNCLKGPNLLLIYSAWLDDGVYSFFFLCVCVISSRISLVSQCTSLERTVTTLKGIHCLPIFVNISVKRSVHSLIVLPVVTFSQSILESEFQNFSLFNLLQLYIVLLKETFLVILFCRKAQGTLLALHIASRTCTLYFLGGFEYYQI